MRTGIRSAVIVLLIIAVQYPLGLTGQDRLGNNLSGLAFLGQGRSRAVTSAQPDPNSNKDRIGIIEPGKTVTLADITGPGVITHIWLTFNEARPNWLEGTGSARPDEIVLRMSWDNGAAPAVESPLGDFFAAGFGLRREIRSEPMQVESGDGYNVFFPMPFHTRALITITNESAKNIRSFYYHIDYLEGVDLPDKTAYFCAQYKQELPEKMGRDYLILGAEGQGQYVGTVMSARARSPLWFGEGDAKFYVDGETKPTIQGTGTEDYFLCAWGLNECLFPYFGCTYLSASPDDLGVRYSLYRWHIADPVRFTKSLRFEIEHKGWISADETESGKIEGHVEREDDIATVAFWYQVGQPMRYTELPPLAQRQFPNLDIIIPGKDMIASARHSAGKVEIQKDYDFTGDGQVFFKPEGDKAYLEMDFNVEKEEYRGFVLSLTHSFDYGTWRILLDGKNVNQPAEAGAAIEDNDLYSAQLGVQDKYVGSYTLATGKHTLRFELVGKNSLSKGNYLGLDSVRLRERWHTKRKLLS